MVVDSLQKGGGSAELALIGLAVALYRFRFHLGHPAHQLGLTRCNKPH
jgi:hypothetical protein